MKKKMNLIHALMLSPVLFLGGCLAPLNEDSVWTSPPVDPPAVAAPVATAVNVGGSGFVPGTFTGVGTGGFYGDVIVEVTFDASRIVDIQIVYHNETPEFANPAFDQILPDMLSRQTSQVDVMSGATVSSRALIAAVTDAISQATAGGFIPGTFTGVGTGGFYGDVTVEVTFDETSMLDIQVVYHNETPEFANPAFDQILPDMLARQTSQVDVMSGATVSSRALIAAVADAMAQAMAGGIASSVATSPATPPVEEDVIGMGDPAEYFAGAEFTPGAFTGVGSGGFGGDITVEATFEAARIADIQVVDHSETPGFANRVFDEIIPYILFNQSIDVDVISGSTMTFDALMAALEDAMNQARGIVPEVEDVDVEGYDEDNENDEVEIDEPEPAVVEPEPAPEPEPVVEEPAVVEPEPAPVVEEPAVVEPEPAPVVEEPAGRFTPGTFTGVGSGGFGGDITVAVTFDADRIVSIQITAHSETQSFVDMVVPAFTDAMIATQGTAVDAVTHATMTSNAIRNAVNSAINQASN